MSVKKFKLTPKQVKAYERLSGLKTTGRVDMVIGDDDHYKLYEQLLTPHPIEPSNGALEGSAE